MKIYSVPPVGYRPVANNTKMSKPVASMFRGNENKVITLPSGVKYEIDEKSLKNSAPQVIKAFYETITALEPAKTERNNFKK